jgi:hypothetical protein
MKEAWYHHHHHYSHLFYQYQMHFLMILAKKSLWVWMILMTTRAYWATGLVACINLFESSQGLLEKLVPKFQAYLK